MTYARSAGVTGAVGSVGSSTGSSRSTGTAVSGNRPARSVRVSTSRTPESAVMNATRAGGYAGSSGT
ncbi:hypothetical protein GA0070214_10538 [Micromonospora chaiyaphumensis]|uniref:Uncharacterized protein n=1 Tax=Micromonospora chaiyaphumensis TaxID=307119 RepID=A0A1C4X298_9ACTN|nr:hypothetical protein GA0070214_10538 [Micromonospora chaiyaphumensis]